MSPASQSRQQLRSEELQELAISGPFSGVQSELSLTEIEPYCFSDTNNIIFRQGVATVRPGYSALPSPDGVNPILGIADFFDVVGAHHQVAMTTTKLWSWNSGTQTWT